MFRIFVLFICISLLVVGFQNCGNDFKSSVLSNNQSPSDSPDCLEIQCSAGQEVACDVANGSGVKVWTGSDYGMCAVKSCLSGYQILQTYCVPVPPAQPFVPKPESLRASAQKYNLFMGTAIHPHLLTLEPMYAQTVAENYNLIVATNVMKWQPLRPAENTYDFKIADELVEFAIRYHQKVHGHTLVWHNQNPPWLVNGSFSATEKQMLLKNHIQTVMKHFKEKYPETIISWDVVNEAFLNSNAEVSASSDGGYRKTIWSDIYASPEEYIRQSFLWAREADPAALLYYNDFSNEDLGAKSTAIYLMVQKLKSQGTPIDVVGMQVHLSTDYGVPTVATLRQNIARLKAIGVKVHFTELDARTNSADGISAIESQKQTQIYANIVDACRLEAGTCLGVTTWGFTEKHSWIPQFFPGYSASLPFDLNYKPTANFETIKSRLP